MVAADTVVEVEVDTVAEEAMAVAGMAGVEAEDMAEVEETA